MALADNFFKSFIHVRKNRKEDFCHLLVFIFLSFFLQQLFVSKSFGQEIDILNVLNDSSSSKHFLAPHLQDHLKLNASDEATNLRRYNAAIEKNNDRQLITSGNNLGIIYLNNEDPQKAILFFKKGLEASVRLKNDKAQIASLIEIGFATQQLVDFKKALGYYSLASKLLETQKLPKITGLVSALMGQCYTALKDYQNAIESFNKAGKAYSLAGLKSQSAFCLNAIGEIQLRNENYEKSLDTFHSAYKLISADPNEKQLQSIILRNLGLVEFKRGGFEKAVDSFNKSLFLNNQLIVQKLVKDAYLQLFTYYGFKNDFLKADAYHDKYRHLKDSLDDLEHNVRKSKIQIAAIEEEKQQIIELLQKKNEEQELQLNQRQLELSKMITKTDIELQNKDQQLVQKDSVVQQLTNENIKRERDLAQKELQLNKQKSFRNLLIAISIGILLLTLLLFNRYQIKKNSNRKLKKSNLDLEEILAELKLTQVKLVHSEKMASLGQLTAGIAHEIQNPLNFVNNFSESGVELINDLKNEKNPEEQLKIYNELILTLDKIQEHGKRADRIVKNMLLHSRSGNNEKEPYDLNKLCEEMADLAYKGTRTNSPSFHCTIVKNMDITIPNATINSQDVGRVLLNVFSNSFYAMNKRSQSEKEYLPKLNISSSITDEIICIKIRDNGNGIPKEVSDRIFEPFFTTKPAGEGTGLGLSLSFDIISKGHGGTIEVESEKDSFTEFRIFLPITG